MKHIFLSHSHVDRPIALELLGHIERLYHPYVKVFMSSHPDAISSGKDWRKEVIPHLEQADVMIVLITPNSEKSTWVSFEVGYFKGKSQSKPVHILRGIDSEIPSPFSDLQSKVITDIGELRNFFATLNKDIDITVELETSSLKSIVKAFDKLVERVPERSFRHFERLLIQSEWNKVYIEPFRETLVCADDMIFQLQVTYDETDDRVFHEPWHSKFPVSVAEEYFVNLVVSGTAVYQYVFVSGDGGRFFVPRPKIDTSSISTENSDVDNQRFYWDMDSIEMKILHHFERAGDRLFSFHHSLKEFADFCGIELRE